MYIEKQRFYVEILKRELVPALGCTEPIAIAYAFAKARQVLACFPERIELRCSGNIIKNVKGVNVPNAKGLKGEGAAAVLGVVAGDADRALEVLETVDDDAIAQTKALLEQGFFTCKLQEQVENLYIVATVFSGAHSASVTIVNRHTLITEIVKDGVVLYQMEKASTKVQSNTPWEVSIKEIVAFAKTVDIEHVRPILTAQIQMNSAIAEMGLSDSYGAEVGKTLLETAPDDVRMRARAYASAGSDARMGGCSLPVIINSGSGNQGMTVSLPVIEYAKAWQVSEEELFRALVISNLTSIHLKHYIGSLSAFCGAVTAACGAGAAITYLAGGTYEALSQTIIGTLANVGGIVCDGAKASCAAKISSAVDAAILAHEMSMRGRYFQMGEGIVKEDLESTIQSMGYVGREGMKETDVKILHVMMEQVDYRDAQSNAR